MTAAGAPGRAVEEMMTDDDLVVLSFALGSIIGFVVGAWLAVEVLTLRRKTDG